MQYHTAEYQVYLTNLKLALQNLEEDDTLAESLGQTRTPPASKLPQIELYRIAALIYLQRTSVNFSGQSEQLDICTTSGFELLKSFSLFQWSFPLFILALEARTDERRILCLRLFDQASHHLYHRHIPIIRCLVERSWIQDDLKPGEHLDYLRKLNLVMSVSTIIPCFV
jgi:hypothetical protein